MKFKSHNNSEAQTISSFTSCRQGSVYAEALLGFNVRANETTSDAELAADVQPFLRTQLTSSNPISIDINKLRVDGKYILHP